MTAQIHDSIFLNDQKLSIVGVQGGELFNPVDFQLHSYQTVTSCWRGYLCEYKVTGDKLVLHTLQVNHEEQGPAINNITPSFGNGMFNNVYDALDLPMNFTGTIEAADKFIRELYVHMGFHPAWKYEVVRELMFSQGTLLGIQDISKAMADLREQMGRQPPFREK